MLQYVNTVAHYCINTFNSILENAFIAKICEAA